MFTCASPQEGQHHDLFKIEELCNMFTKASINIKGLFMNTDSGSDSLEFRQICKDKENEANIDINTCNSKYIKSICSISIFLIENYRRRELLLNMLLPGWIDLNLNCTMVKLK